MRNNEIQFVTRRAPFFHRSSVAGGPRAPVQYHPRNIVAIRAKVNTTTLIEVPPAEKIMEAATGDQGLLDRRWVGNFLLLCTRRNKHQLQLESHYGQGNSTVFTLHEVSASSADPDLKGDVDPPIAPRCGHERSAQFVPPPLNWNQSKQQVAALQSHVRAGGG